MPLPRSFFARDTKTVARELIGTQLVSRFGDKQVSGTIVETEAYLSKRDSACHAAKARTARTEVMFGPAGMAYVYPIHAKFCFNVVTEFEERGCAVLIRAVDPTTPELGSPEQIRDSCKIIEHRRGVSALRRLTTGPANLCQAFGIDRRINGADLTLGGPVWFEPKPNQALAILPNQGLGTEHTDITIKSSKRIGVTSAHARRLRFYVAGNPFVSGTLKLRS